MLAKAVAGLDAVPDIPGTLFEPKWDGFRCIVFREGDQVELGSRNDRPLTRYFPEILDPLRASLPDRCVVDGELVVVTDDGLDFDALQLRLHPAESRVRKLAAEIPSSFVAFDLLALGDRSLLEEPLSERRRLARGGPGRRPAAGPRHADHDRPRRRRRLVRAVRRARASTASSPRTRPSPTAATSGCCGR